MPIVTNLKGNKKEYTVTITLENGLEKTFTCSEDLVVAFRLVNGKELNQDTYKTFVIDQKLDGLIEKVKRYLLLALRSEQEARLYLANHGADQKEVDMIVLKMKRIGLIDDPGFAKSLVESLFNQKRFGKEKIIFNLESRGFPSSLVKTLVAGITLEAVNSNLEYLFKKKIVSFKSGSCKASYDKMKRHLLAKGYGVHDVMAFVDDHRSEFENQIQEDQEILKDLSRLEKRYQRTGDSQEDLKTKLIRGLLARGYSYPLIKKTLERRR